MPFLERKTFRTRESERRRMRRQLIRTGIIAGVAGLLLILVGFLARLDTVTIRQVSVEGGETVPHAEVRERVFNVLSGSYALIIPRRFAYLFPKEEIVREVGSIPRIDTVSVERISRTEIKVTFTEHAPHALWCDSVSLAASSTPRCLFVNEFGYAFADAPPLKGGALMRYQNEERVPEVGLPVFDGDLMKTVEEFARGIERRHHLRIRAVALTNDGDLVFHLREGGTILVPRHGDIQAAFDNLASILASEEFKDLAPEDIEYIDLRFGDKVYLREKSATPAPVATSTEAINSVE